MPRKQLDAATSTWTLPVFDEIEIVYTTKDIWSEEGSDPHIEFVQYVTGQVSGVMYGEGDEHATPLGTVHLARIDMYEVGTAISDALDAHSGEWVNCYYPIVADDGPLEDELVKTFVIFDSVKLRPEARGHGLGLLVLARAIRTWASGIDCVALIAGPLRDEKPAVEPDVEERREFGAPENPARLAIGERLAKHWMQLGFERIPQEPGRMPVLYLLTDRTTVDEALRRFSRWTSPVADE